MRDNAQVLALLPQVLAGRFFDVRPVDGRLLQPAQLDQLLVNGLVGFVLNVKQPSRVVCVDGGKQPGNFLYGDGVSHRIAFVRADANAYIGELETASIDLTCTNRDLPLALAVDDINVICEFTPPLATYTNICAPTRPYRPVLDGQLQWALISNMSLNYLSLLSRAAESGYSRL